MLEFNENEANEHLMRISQIFPETLLIKVSKIYASGGLKRAHLHKLLLMNGSWAEWCLFIEKSEVDSRRHIQKLWTSEQMTFRVNVGKQMKTRKFQDVNIWNEMISEHRTCWTCIHWYLKLGNAFEIFLKKKKTLRSNQKNWNFSVSLLTLEWMKFCHFLSH